MKKFWMIGIVGMLTFFSCQDELYKDATKEFEVELGVYMPNTGVIQSFVKEHNDVLIKDLQVSLTKKTTEEVRVSLVIEGQEVLDKYNKQNGTDYIVLPENMYEMEKNIVLAPNAVSQTVPVVLKNLEFSPQGTYALPVKIQGGSTNLIPGETSALLVFEPIVSIPVMKFAGSGAEDAGMFPDDFKVDVWTFEMMVMHSVYNSNNVALGGTKVVSGSSTLDEIYPRFGDVTIKYNQFQLKTAGSQIDVPLEKFSAQPNEWYMISMVYDGKKNYIYVNGELVADREMRTGPYGLTGFWLSGRNEWLREIRFWKVARSQKQIKQSLWKSVNPDDEGLLLYYPMNGKKRDSETGEITENTTKIWDWSKSQKHLKVPSGAVMDNNGGEGYQSPPQDVLGK